jgi:hypothetical protein
MENDLISPSRVVVNSNEVEININRQTKARSKHKN